MYSERKQFYPRTQPSDSSTARARHQRQNLQHTSDRRERRCKCYTLLLTIQPNFRRRLPPGELIRCQNRRQTIAGHTFHPKEKPSIKTCTFSGFMNSNMHYLSKIGSSRPLQHGLKKENASYLSDHRQPNEKPDKTDKGSEQFLAVSTSQMMR